MRSKIVIGVLALATLVPALAFAQGNKGDEKASFPMPAAEFQQKVQARETKMKEVMEKRIANLPADKQKEIREKVAAKEAAVNAAVQNAIADGTVTADEAKAVRAGGGLAGVAPGAERPGSAPWLIHSTSPAEAAAAASAPSTTPSFGPPEGGGRSAASNTGDGRSCGGCMTVQHATQSEGCRRRRASRPELVIALRRSRLGGDAAGRLGEVNGFG